MRSLLTLTTLTTLALLATACRTAPAPAPEPAPPPVAVEPLPADPEAFRDEPPRPGPAPELVLPRFEQATLDNGLTVWVSPRPELPLVYVGVAFAAGSASDPAGKWGLADLTYKMLLEGAAGRDTLALDQAFQALGVSPTVSTRQDGATLGVRVLRRHAEAALALLTQVVRQPTFSPRDFERRQKLQQASLVQMLGEPFGVGQQALVEAVFGAAHPYGHLSVGLPKTVSAVTVRDVKAFHEAHVGPRTTALVMTGDITLEQAVALAKKSFGDWKSPATLPPVPPVPAVPARTRVVVVPKPALDQTLMLLGRPGVAAGNPDESALELANTVFGGFFGSRLNMNLREDKGYSYGVAAFSNARLGVGSLLVYAMVRADATGPAIAESFKELKGLVERPINPRELEPAREGLVRAFPGNFETVEGLGASASALFLTRRPPDEFTREVAGLREATPEHVQKMVESYLGSDTLQIVLVGDPDLIRKQVGPLGLGELVVVEPTKALVPPP